MTSPYFLSQSFITLFNDAVHMMFSSLDAVKEGYSPSAEAQVMARASILNSVLILESAANCCISELQGARAFLNDIDKTPPLTKLDLYAKFKKNRYLDRGNAIVSTASELLTVRNSIVHPKKQTAGVDVEKNDQRDDGKVEFNFLFDRNARKATGLDKVSYFWSPLDAKNVLKSVIDFLNYYFIELLEFEANDVLSIIGDGIVQGDKMMIFNSELFEANLERLVEHGFNVQFWDVSNLRKLSAK